MMRVETLHGAALKKSLHDLARLRITVFREWPYLYEGSIAYETGYLKAYQNCAESIVVVAKNEANEIVGSSTALPLEHADVSFSQPFEAAGINPATVLYLGESVLLPEYRGKGVGKVFFRERLSHARFLGRKMAAFCAVERSLKDARRPLAYKSLDPFWAKIGFTKQPGLQARLSWREVDAVEETPHSLTFWTLELVNAKGGG